MATLNLIGNLVITDLNGAQRLLPLSAASATYTADSEQTYTIAAGATQVIYNLADAAVSVSTFTSMFLYPSIALDLEIAVDATALSANSAWMSIPLAATQVFPLFRNVFYYQYVNGIATSVYAGTGSGKVVKMRVKEPTGTTAGNIQVFLAS